MANRLKRVVIPPVIYSSHGEAPSGRHFSLINADKASMPASSWLEKEFLACAHGFIEKKDYGQLRTALEGMLSGQQSRESDLGATFIQKGAQIDLQAAHLHMPQQLVPNRDGFIIYDDHGKLFAVERRGGSCQFYNLAGTLVSPWVRQNILRAQANYLLACLDFAQDEPEDAKQRFKLAFDLLDGRFIIQKHLESQKPTNAGHGRSMAPSTTLEPWSGVVKVWNKNTSTMQMVTGDRLGQKRQFYSDEGAECRPLSRDYKAYAALFDATRELRFSTIKMYNSICQASPFGHDDADMKKLAGIFDPSSIERTPHDPYTREIRAECRDLSKAFWLIHAALFPPKSVL